MPCPYVVLGAARDRGLSRSHSRLFRPLRLNFAAGLRYDAVLPCETTLRKILTA